MLIVGNSGQIVLAAEANVQPTEQKPILEMSAEKAPIPVDDNLNKLSNNDRLLTTINSYVSDYLQNKHQGISWLRYSNISFNFAEGYKPEFSFETLKPFYQDNNSIRFIQGHYSLQDGDSLFNIGYGNRKFVDAKKDSIVGYNVFYDRAFTNNHSRIGTGLEYFKGNTEYRTNFYLPISGERQISSVETSEGIFNTYEKAVRGFDYEIGSSLKNAPWATLYATGFFFDNKHSANEEGYRLRSKLNLTPRLNMELGYQNSNTSNEFYGKVTYNLTESSLPTLWGNKTEQAVDMAHKMFQKVEREYNIRTETYTRLIPFTGSVKATVLDGNNNPLQGVRVQAYKAGSPVGNVAVTDTNGEAILSAPAGTYTIHASYFTYSGDSGTVTLTKNAVTNTTISLPVTGGTVVVGVVTDSSTPIEGATVIAESTDSLHAGLTFVDKLLGVKQVFAASTDFSVSVQTNASGKATFNNLPPGNYRFRIIHGNTVVKTPSVEVISSQTTTNTTVLNSAGGNIAVEVKDKGDNSIIAGATVELIDGMTTISTKTSNDKGLVAFSQLATNKSYTVKVSKGSAIKNFSSITVNDTETTDILAYLDVRNDIIAIFTDGANPISMATVSITVDGVAQTLTTDSSGRVTFTNMPSGQFTVAISKAGFVSTTTSMTIANGRATVGAVHLQEQLGRIVIGVSDGSNNYLSNATATFRVGDALVTATSTADGVITFENVTAGTYSVTVSKDGYNSVTFPVTVTAGNQSLSSVRLLPIVLNTATITLVDSNTHNPISNATVSVADNGYSKNVVTGSSGQVVFTDMPDGTYTFYVTADNYYGARPSYTITGGTSLNQTITLNPLMGSATLTVLDDESRPVDSATVSIVVNGITQTATTSSSGIAAMSLPVGIYSYTVSKSGYTSYNGNVTVRYSTDSAQTAVLIQQPLGTVNVQVLNMATLPIAGVQVQISGNGVNDTKVTDSRGRVYFSNVPYGSYTVSTLYLGFPASSSVMVADVQPYPYVALRVPII